MKSPDQENHIQEILFGSKGESLEVPVFNSSYGIVTTTAVDRITADLLPKDPFYAQNADLNNLIGRFEEEILTNINIWPHKLTRFANKNVADVLGLSESSMTVVLDLIRDNHILEVTTVLTGNNIPRLALTQENARAFCALAWAYREREGKRGKRVNLEEIVSHARNGLGEGSLYYKYIQDPRPVLEELFQVKENPVESGKERTGQPWIRRIEPRFEEGTNIPTFLSFEKDIIKGWRADRLRRGMREPYLKFNATVPFEYEDFPIDRCVALAAVFIHTFGVNNGSIESFDSSLSTLTNAELKIALGYAYSYLNPLENAINDRLTGSVNEDERFALDKRKKNLNLLTLFNNVVDKVRENMPK